MKSVFQFGVDNILCHAADPTFVGFCAARDADCASKTVAKASAHEPVGVVALADGAPAVVEYSEISREMAEATGPDGRLLYGSAHICVNYFSMSFLRTFCEGLLHTLPLHVARKKIPHVLPDGTRVTPTVNNGVKLELFIFDTFPHAQRMAALQVRRTRSRMRDAWRRCRRAGGVLALVCACGSRGMGIRWARTCPRDALRGSHNRAAALPAGASRRGVRAGQEPSGRGLRLAGHGSRAHLLAE